MTAQHAESALIKLHDSNESALKKLLSLTQLIDNADLIQTVEDILDKIRSPFTFVIVGEVKAGKSSFINALLESDKEICKVAPSPMTDSIQLITYGEQEREETVNEHYKRMYHNVDILKEISIVDTPGTNTIIDHHQEITERFIPHADLIVFVFEAKNPYRQSAWEFFDYISDEWRKKIIFILQQKDLMNDDDLATNINGVIEEAIQKQIAAPPVVGLSAKMEQHANYERTGFGPL